METKTSAPPFPARTAPAMQRSAAYIPEAGHRFHDVKPDSGGPPPMPRPHPHGKPALSAKCLHMASAVAVWEVA